MYINIKVNPRSKNERIEKIDDKNYRAYFNVAPEKGRANEKLIELLSDYFQTSKPDIVIKLGKTAKEKVIQISGLKSE